MAKTATQNKDKTAGTQGILAGAGGIINSSQKNSTTQNKDKTAGTAKTAEQYKTERLTSLNADTENSYERRVASTQKTKADKTASTDKYITGAHDIIDSGLERSTQRVQQQIDAAPGEYQGLFDRNALSEEVGRQAAELKMANMGLTDSGLSSSSQAALSVQRMNADASARKSMRDYVNSLENAITDMTVAAENEKKQIALDARRADDQYFLQLDAEDRNWHNNALDANLTNAYVYGDTMFANDEANRATKEAAEIQAEAEVQAAQIEAQNKESDDLAEYAQFLMKEMGYSEDAALAAATSRRSTGDAERDAYVRNYSAATKMGYSDAEAAAYATAGGGTAGVIAATEKRASAANISLNGITEVHGGGSAIGDSWASAKDDLKHAKGGAWTQDQWDTSIERAVDQAVHKLKNSGLDEGTKKIAAAIAVGYEYATAVNEKTMTKVYNALGEQFGGEAFEVACMVAGIGSR